MKFTSFLHKKLVDLLNDRRIVVWYDADGAFKDFVRAFNAPNCVVLSAEESVLKTRRRADEIYRFMNESEDPGERDRCMLIYIPGRRGVTEDERMRDPFEVYAMAGTAFGDTEDQKAESLARQAMPDRAEEITRLFREGKPTIDLLDGLEKSQRWPLLNEVFGTETPADVVALALCDKAKAGRVDEKPGCIEELLRLFEDAVGFKSGSTPRNWETLRPKAAQHVLFSEFVFDLPDGPPDALSAVSRAGGGAESVVLAACERMRADSNLRDTYVELACRIENDLGLPHVMPADFDPGERDTFPFEERCLLKRAADLVIAGDMDAAKGIAEVRRGSIWRRQPERSTAWTTLERAMECLDTAARIADGVRPSMPLSDLLKAYTEGGWSDLDRAYRLFESALTAGADEAALTAVVELCRRRYREAVLKLQEVFLAAVQAEGWPPEGAPKQTRVFDDYVAPVLERRGRTAYFMVDSLRFEMGRDLGEALARAGEVEVRYAAGVFPTVTIVGMAALMPGADGMLRLVEKNGGLVPALGERPLKTSSDRMKLLSETYGDRFFETTLDDLLGAPKKMAPKLKNIDLLVVRTQDPDAIGENLGSWRARKYLSDIIGDLAGAVRRVTDWGFDRVVITSDHGHMMLPEIPAGDVLEEPPGDWVEKKRRCLLGSGLLHSAGTITLKAVNVGIQGDVQDACLPVGFRVFSDGNGYFHGGLSLQEAVVPVVVFRAGRDTKTAAGKPEIDISYRWDKFTSRVIGLKITYRVRQLNAFGNPPAVVKVEAYDGSGAGAHPVGEAADCEARDERTREVTLHANVETPVPVLISPDFDGPEVEIRVSDPGSKVVWAAMKLKNAMLD